MSRSLINSDGCKLKPPIEIQRLAPFRGEAMPGINGSNRKIKPALLSEISEMKIEQKKYGGFDLILYPVRTQVKVRADSTLNEDRLQYMMLTLDVIRELDLSSKIEELDVRAGTASYRLRGEANE